MEKDPTININLGSDKFEMTRRNSSLHTFIGKMALYDHVYLLRDDLPEENGAVCVTPLYRDLMVNKNIWDVMAQQMANKEFPLYLNHPSVSPSTVANYEDSALHQMQQALEKNGDTVPEGWL